MSFEKDMDKFIKKTDLRMQMVVTDSITTLASGVIEDTPVDTGRAKGNWQGAVDEKPMNSLINYDPTGASTLDRVSLAAKNAAGHVFYLVNNVIYAIPLEFGHSKQSPRGMVRINAIRWKSIVRDAVYRASK